MFKKHNRKNSEWTLTEINLLEELYVNKKMKIHEITKFLPDRTKNAIAMRINLCGFSKHKKLEWSEEEIAILKSNYSSMDAKELQKLIPERSCFQINQKAYKLGLEKGRNDIWKKSEINYLIKNYDKLDCKTISSYLNRPLNSIKSKAQRLMSEGIINNKTTKWSKIETKILIYLHKKIPNKQIALILNKPIKSIEHKIYKLKKQSGKDNT